MKYFKNTAKLKVNIYTVNNLSILYTKKKTNMHSPIHSTYQKKTQTYQISWQPYTILLHPKEVSLDWARVATEQQINRAKRWGDGDAIEFASTDLQLRVAMRCRVTSNVLILEKLGLSVVISALVWPVEDNLTQSSFLMVRSYKYQLKLNKQVKLNKTV